MIVEVSSCQLFGMIEMLKFGSFPDKLKCFCQVHVKIRKVS